METRSKKPKHPYSFHDTRSNYGKLSIDTCPDSSKNALSDRVQLEYIEKIIASTRSDARYATDFFDSSTGTDK